MKTGLRLVFLWRYAYPLLCLLVRSPASVYLPVSICQFRLVPIRWRMASGSACLQHIGPYRIEHQGWWASSYAGAMPKRQGDAR